MRIPKYREHSTRDKGFVEWQGKRVYFLGRYNSPESRAAYREFLAKNCGIATQPLPVLEGGLSVAGLGARYLTWLYEQEGGNKRGVFTTYKYALKPLVDKHGHELAEKFGPLALKRLQESLAEREHKRSYVDNCISAIKQVFRWAVSEELLPPAVYQALATVRGLRPGKSKAQESVKKSPVPWSYVELVLPEVSPTVRAMLLLQWYSGVRSQSVCQARPSQFTQDGDILAWRPRHKTESLGIELVLPLGPRAQEVLAPFLQSQDDRFLFSPRSSNSNRRYNDHYTTTNYNNCLRAGILKLNRKLAKTNCPPLPLWSPHRLRHSKGTMVRATYGLEATAATLGHSEIATSQIYSQKRYDLACQVARETG